MHHKGIVLKLVAFEVAVESALTRVLVLDPHFDEVGLTVLGPALSRSQALDVRLLTSRSGIDDQDRERRRKELVITATCTGRDPAESRFDGARILTGTRSRFCTIGLPSSMTVCGISARPSAEGIRD